MFFYSSNLCSQNRLSLCLFKKPDPDRRKNNGSDRIRIRNGIKLLCLEKVGVHGIIQSMMYYFCINTDIVWTAFPRSERSFFWIVLLKLPSNLHREIHLNHSNRFISQCTYYLEGIFKIKKE